MNPSTPLQPLFSSQLFVGQIFFRLITALATSINVDILSSLPRVYRLGIRTQCMLIWSTNSAGNPGSVKFLSQKIAKSCSQTLKAWKYPKILRKEDYRGVVSYHYSLRSLVLHFWLGYGSVAIGLSTPRLFVLNTRRNTVSVHPRTRAWDMVLKSSLAPILKDKDISYTRVRFNGSLMKENVFRQTGSPAVDEAWSSLGVDCKLQFPIRLRPVGKLLTLTGLWYVDRPAIVPDDLAAQSGLLPDQVKVSEKYGGGYPANVEGLHHLHCLVGNPQNNTS